MLICILTKNVITSCSVTDRKSGSAGMPRPISTLSLHDALPISNPNELNQDDARYGFRCCHLKNIWTAPLPPETELSRQMTTSTTSIDIMGLQAAYANLHTDQERDYFMQRYHDVIS